MNSTQILIVKSALKIIPNDTDIAYERQNFQIENRLFNFCVGETVGASIKVTDVPTPYEMNDMNFR